MIKLIFIDDNEGDLELLKAYLKPLSDIVIDTFKREPDYNLYHNYDGVIVDQYLENGRLGLDVATVISQNYPMIPIMLYTGSSPLDTPDAKSIVDEVCDKNDLSEFGRSFLSFLRQIERVKTLRNTISELENKLRGVKHA